MIDKKKVVLFDIDYTLFDTEDFRKNLYKNISQAVGEDINKIEPIGKSIYAKLRKKYGYFNPAEFIKNFKGYMKNDVDFSAVEESIWNEEAFRRCIYKEVDDILSEIKKIAQVGIFSKGHDRFQRAKLKTIEHFLEIKHIHIVVDKYANLPQIINKYAKHKLYLVDDELEALHFASKLRSDVFTIWVKRGRYAAEQKPIPGFTPNLVVTNLRKIVKIIGR